MVYGKMFFFFLIIYERRNYDDGKLWMEWMIARMIYAGRAIADVSDKNVIFFFCIVCGHAVFFFACSQQMAFYFLLNKVV